MYVCMCICAAHTCSAYGSQKRTLEGPLEMGLQKVVTTMWVLRAKPGSSAKAASVLDHCRLLPNALPFLLGWGGSGTRTTELAQSTIADYHLCLSGLSSPWKPLSGCFHCKALCDEWSLCLLLALFSEKSAGISQHLAFPRDRSTLRSLPGCSWERV